MALRYIRQNSYSPYAFLANLVLPVAFNVASVATPSSNVTVALAESLFPTFLLMGVNDIYVSMPDVFEPWVRPTASISVVGPLLKVAPTVRGATLTSSRRRSSSRQVLSRFRRSTGSSSLTKPNSSSVPRNLLKEALCASSSLRSTFSLLSAHAIAHLQLLGPLRAPVSPASGVRLIRRRCQGPAPPALRAIS